MLSQLNKDSEVDAAAAHRSRNQVTEALCTTKRCACISTRAQVHIINHSDSNLVTCPAVTGVHTGGLHRL